MNTSSLGLSATQIVAKELFPSSSWYFGQARAWLDLAKRENVVGPIHYAAFELRYGIEYLLFELTYLSCESLSNGEYQTCLGKPKEMKKILKSTTVMYKKLSDFTGIVMQLERGAPATIHWDVNELFQLWGVASDRLHFCGIHAETYQEQDWKTATIARLDQAIESVWQKVTTADGVAIMKPADMTPAVRDIWSDYSASKIDRVQAAARLELARPVSAQQKKRLQD